MNGAASGRLDQTGAPEGFEPCGIVPISLHPADPLVIVDLDNEHMRQAEVPSLIADTEGFPSLRAADSHLEDNGTAISTGISSGDLVRKIGKHVNQG